MALVMINDLTTKYPNPPTIKALAGQTTVESLVYRDENWQIQGEKHPDVKPLIVPNRPIPEVIDLIVKALTPVGNIEWIEVDKAGGRIQGISKTAILRFKDDFVILVEPHDGNLIVHMRSKSRLGRSDLGANAKRIKEYLARIQSAL